MQNHAIEAVTAREPLVHLRGGGTRPIGRAALTRRRMAGDAPAPGIGGLSGAAIGIGQVVAGGHVHHHEGIEHHLQAAILQIADQPDHGFVARSAAIGGRAFHERHRFRILARQPGHRPCGAIGGFRLHVHARFDEAGAGAQVVAEPAHHEGHPLEVRAQGLQGIERCPNIACALQLMAVLRPGFAEVEHLHHRKRIVAELARAGDEAHGADHAVEAVDGPHDLEGELRHAVAEIGKRQALEHHIGETAIGRRMISTLLGDDQRIVALRLAALVHPHRERAEIEFASVGPDPADEGDAAFAQPNRQIGEIGIGGGDGLRPAHALAALRTPVGVGVHHLFQARRPDELAADARAAIDPRDRRALR